MSTNSGVTSAPDAEREVLTGLPGGLAGEVPSFSFTSADTSMVASGVDATVPKTTCAGDRAALAQRVSEFLRGAARFGRSSPTVVGAVPFDDALPAHLVLPSAIHRLDRRRSSTPRTRTRQGWSVRRFPGDQEYQRELSRLLRRVRAGQLDKAVLARCLELTTVDPVDPVTLLDNLKSAAETDTYTFGVRLPRRGEDGTRDACAAPPELTRTLVGMSPLLLSKHGTQVTVSAHVGSAPRGDDRSGDRRRRESLLAAGDGEAATQTAVEALRPLCSTLRVSPQRKLTTTQSMWHLRREITAVVPDPYVSSLMLATAVHPSHSLCGTPARAAKHVVSRSEPFDRGYYSGLVGWCDSAGDGQWAPAAQCAEIEDRTLRAYTHAEVLPDCDPHAESEATSMALRNWLAALGCVE